MLMRTILIVKKTFKNAGLNPVRSEKPVDGKPATMQTNPSMVPVFTFIRVSWCGRKSWP